MELLLGEHKKIEAQDAEFVARAQGGDRLAFEELYRGNVDQVYGLCLRLSADVSLAEELTQKTFIRAWERLKSFRGESAFSSWLHRIAVNIAISDRRSQGRWLARVVYTDDLERFDGSNGSESPESNVDLEQAVLLLPAGARTILILHDLEGYRHEEIAIMLEITPGTSKSQLHRAHQLLKERLQQ